MTTIVEPGMAAVEPAMVAAEPFTPEVAAIGRGERPHATIAHAVEVAVEVVAGVHAGPLPPTTIGLVGAASSHAHMAWTAHVARAGHAGIEGPAAAAQSVAATAAKSIAATARRTALRRRLRPCLGHFVRAPARRRVRQGRRPTARCALFATYLESSSLPMPRNGLSWRWFPRLFGASGEPSFWLRSCQIERLRSVSTASRTTHSRNSRTNSSSARFSGLIT